MSDEEFDFEAEAEDGGAIAAAKAKIKKLKEELSECKAERQEYLDGWQRMRADVANQKRDETGRSQRLHERAVEEVLEDIVPALDAFDMAMQGEAWQAVDKNWRAGVEYIRNQLVSALEKHGVSSYGAPGDVFDAHLYEAAGGEGEVSLDAVLRVERVLRKGYKIGDRLLRPAQVLLK